MSDKVKIVGSDGSDRYLLIDNKIIDVRTHTCKDFKHLTDGEHLVCPVCGKPIIELDPSEELINGN